MQPFRVHLAALKNNGGSDSATVNLGQRRPFIAWGSVTMIDPLTDFDRDNAVAFDIFRVDGSRTNTRVFGGDHWGNLGSGNNVFDSVVIGSGQFIEFWLRSIHTADLDSFGVGIVLTLD